TTRGDSSRMVSSDPSDLMKEDQKTVEQPTEKHQLSSESPIVDKAVDEDSLIDNSCSQRTYDSQAKKSIDENQISHKDHEKTDDFSILSPDVGSRVASSFDQLVVALREADCRSLDQISTDILRPMLREWLDDNLPVMVERLVKEEIEKIARGTPRR
ncbi:PopZ family protein, partial [Candidatus Liberibacter sp.]|uniref:PopZ family protein n=1 Tax=Candidatus Liberibacter sp. TaxID=34022 RepID=UPI0015F3F83A